MIVFSASKRSWRFILPSQHVQMIPYAYLASRRLDGRVIRHILMIYTPRRVAERPTGSRLVDCPLVFRVLAPTRREPASACPSRAVDSNLISPFSANIHSFVAPFSLSRTKTSFPTRICRTEASMATVGAIIHELKGAPSSARMAGA